MKIALIGTHGTGKTTLAHELVVLLKKQRINAEFLGEVARDCPLPINEERTKEAQKWIIYTQYVKELEMERKGDVLVCDRSVLDGYVYYYHKFGEDRLLEDFIKENLENYRLLLKIPVRDGYLKEDGIRSTDNGFQEEIDKMFHHLLEKLNIPFKEYNDLNEVINILR